MTLDFIFKACTGQTAQYWLDCGNLDWYDKYADPRQDTPKRGVLTANWNEFPREGNNEFNWSTKGRKFQDLLERAGYSLEWSDQTLRCDHCYGCITEGPDYYGDSAHYAFLDDCAPVCAHCIRKDFTEEYLEGLEDRGAVAIHSINPAKHGYVKVAGEFENGFHPGQTDDPRKIAKDLRAKGYGKLVFMIDEGGQFDVRFSVYAKQLPTMADWQRTLSEVYA